MIRIIKNNSGGHTQVSNELLRSPVISQTARLVYINLLSHAEGYDLRIRQLMADVGASRKTIERSLGELQDLGLLQIDHKFTKEGRRTNSDYNVYWYSYLFPIWVFGLRDGQGMNVKIYRENLINSKGDESKFPLSKEELDKKMKESGANEVGYSQYVTESDTPEGPDGKDPQDAQGVDPVQTSPVTHTYTSLVTQLKKNNINTPERCPPSPPPTFGHTVPAADASVPVFPQEGIGRCAPTSPKEQDQTETKVRKERLESCPVKLDSIRLSKIYQETRDIRELLEAEPFKMNTRASKSVKAVNRGIRDSGVTVDLINEYASLLERLGHSFGLKSNDLQWFLDHVHHEVTLCRKEYQSKFKIAENDNGQ